MSLYDDDDTVTDKSAASGWASGIKMMQNQLAFKKATITAPKRDQFRKRTTDKLPPVVDLKSRKDEEENTPPYLGSMQMENSRAQPAESAELEWNLVNEYDPLWPNEYEKVVKDMREKRDREEDDKRRQDREEREKKRRDREESGFSRPRPTEEEEEEERDRDRPSRRGAGAAIAPPPSLDGSPPNVLLPTPSPSHSQQRSSAFGGFGSSVAAKIMAKYGFKEGQGLGKSQQGIVKALEVEKTSKRGGRIVNDSDVGSGSPPPMGAMPPPVGFPVKGNSSGDKQEPSISAILRAPSKVAMLLNMVGPGEVDDDLEPEVREECSSKYGNVTQVVIFEIPRAIPEEAVRIFVEFQRVEASTKAVIDLNGRFFGGRQVKAGFYDYENFKAYKLNEPL